VTSGAPLLLDTHVLVWAVHEPGRLSDDARALVSGPSHQLLVSAVSGWELATKHRVGKLPGGALLVATFAQQAQDLGAELVDITTEDAILAGSFGWSHRDPFDRMLAAQAVTRSAVLVTADPALTALEAVRTAW
jgi:PIN domain nuclease of toxin-antitoxin system